MMVTLMIRGIIVKIMKATTIMMEAEKEITKCNIEAKELEQEGTQEVS